MNRLSPFTWLGRGNLAGLALLIAIVFGVMPSENGSVNRLWAIAAFPLIIIQGICYYLGGLQTDKEAKEESAKRERETIRRELLASERAADNDGKEAVVHDENA